MSLLTCGDHLSSAFFPPSGCIVRCISESRPKFLSNSYPVVTTPTNHLIIPRTTRTRQELTVQLAIRVRHKEGKFGTKLVHMTANLDITVNTGGTGRSRLCLSQRKVNGPPFSPPVMPLHKPKRKHECPLHTFIRMSARRKLVIILNTLLLRTIQLKSAPTSMTSAFTFA